MRHLEDPRLRTSQPRKDLPFHVGGDIAGQQDGNVAIHDLEHY